MTTEMLDQDTDLEVIEGGGALALSAVDKAALDVAVTTAKQYPRSVDKSLKEALTLATLDEETAASCFYVLPRAGKKIEGPSARLAEIMAYSWGNLRVDADIVDEDRTHVTAMGTAIDLERNVAVRVRVKRRITNKEGRRYDADMIGVTGNAAISIALRNAVFKVIPAALTNRIYKEARRASIGEAGTMTQKRQAAVEWFGKTGIPEETLYELLEVRGLDDIGEDELITLRGLMTAIRDGETTVESLLRRTEDASEQTSSLNEELKNKARKGRGTKAQAEPSEAEPPPPTEQQKAEHARKKAQAQWLAFCEAEGWGIKDRVAFEAEVLHDETELFTEDGVVDGRKLQPAHYERLAEALAEARDEQGEIGV